MMLASNFLQLCASLGSQSIKLFSTSTHNANEDVISYVSVYHEIFGTFRNEKGECHHVQRDGKRQNNDENSVRESCRKRSRI
jgi:hypothetical protein